MARSVLVGLVLLVGLGLGVGRAEAAITVTFNSAPPEILVPQSSPMLVSVDVNSTFDVATVVARVGAVTENLAPATLPTWQAGMNLTSLPYGNLMVEVTATDVFGATATVTRTFAHDEPPVVTVTSPLPNTVARPWVHVVATCTDDNPGGACRQFGAGGPGAGVAGVNNMIDAMIDVSAGDGTAGFVSITARNYWNQPVGPRIPIFVELSPDLTEVVSLGVRMLDVDNTRYLYVGVDGKVRVQRRSDGQETILGPIEDLGPSPPHGSLTSVGAVYASMKAPMGGCQSSEELFEWRGAGAPVSLGRPCQANGFTPWSIVGDWGWRLENSPNATRRNVATGASSTVTFPPDVGGPYTGGNRYILDRDGGLVRTIVDGDDVRFVRDRDGVQTELGRGRYGQVNAVYDGIALAFLQGDNPNDRVALVRAGMPPLVLGDPLIPQWPFLTYNVGGGHVAFTRVSLTSGARQIWRRAPDGTEQNLTPFAADSVIDTVAPDGQVTVITGGQTRYLATGAATPPLHVGSELGRARFLGDGLYIVIGRSLLKLNGGAGGLAPDAGVPVDAGVDPDAASAVGGGGGGGCATGGDRAGAATLALLSLGLAHARRRRSRA